MNSQQRVRSRDVTLGPGARAAAERYGILESDLKLARAVSVATNEMPQYLVVISRLPEPDGRRVQMSCLHETPGHIVSVRLT